MKFKYVKHPNFAHPTEKWISRPQIPVRLSHNSKQIRVYALVDSGADKSLFHSSIARELGISLKDAQKEEFFGIAADAKVTAYIHKVKVQVEGAGDSINIDVGFTDSEGVGAILGQSGFFDHYNIRFERSKEQIELVPAKKKKR